MTKDDILQLVEALADMKASNDRRLDTLKAGTEARAHELDEKITKIDGVIMKFTTLKRDIEEEFEAQKSRIEVLECRLSELEAK